MILPSKEFEQNIFSIVSKNILVESKNMNEEISSNDPNSSTEVVEEASIMSESYQLEVDYVKCSLIPAASFNSEGVVGVSPFEQFVRDSGNDVTVQAFDLNISLELCKLFIKGFYEINFDHILSIKFYVKLRWTELLKKHFLVKCLPYKFPNLLRLNLEGNSLNRISVAYLIDYIKMESCQVNNINLTNCGLDINLLTPIFDAFKTARKPLLGLHIGYCELGNEGLKKVCDLIKSSFSSMKELTLDGNHITREGCASLWDAFSNSRHQFEWISLNNNKLGLKGIDKLKYGLLTCFHLGQLYLNNTGFENAKTQEDKEKWLKLQNDMRKCLPDTYISFENVEPSGVPVSSTDLVGLDVKEKNQNATNNSNDSNTKK